MFLKWKRDKSPGWKHKSLINGLGAIVTVITVILIGITKFLDGAWIVCVIVPLLVYLMLKIKKHYTEVAQQMKLCLDQKSKDVALNYNDQHSLYKRFDIKNRMLGITP